MSSTVLYKPKWFNSQYVRDMTGNSVDREFTEDELRDLWGYVKTFTRKSSMVSTEIRGERMDVFQTLCQQVRDERKRYNIIGGRKRSPSNIAKTIGSKSGELDTIVADVKQPELGYEILARSSELKVVIKSGDVDVQSSKIVVQDFNESIERSEINEKSEFEIDSLDTHDKIKTNNSITTVLYSS